MAETDVFNIADKVLDQLSSIALREGRLAWGLNSELKMLANTISTIRAVLLDAEKQQENNPQLTDWLGKIKDALYDADDVLDKFQYEALRSQVVNRRGIKRKVRKLFPRSNPLRFRFKMGHKIKEILEKFDEIAAGRRSYFGFIGENRQIEHKRVRYRQTDSFVPVSDVFGRYGDKETIVELLMNRDYGESVSVIPIVGIGGLGKTTLAKLVYNDDRVCKHFELRMWICVSQDFEVERLIKEIIEAATGEFCNDLITGQLQYRLQKILKGKRFLLILDDVWNDDRQRWRELRQLLSSDFYGSKIIVTTRSQLVASVMGGTFAYKLERLPHQDSLYLFLKCAFREGEERKYPNLLKIGEEIVKKCAGVPLAVMTLGSFLYLKTDERDWLFLKDNEIWLLEQKENDILPALKLSYDAMPYCLKQCFSYCSIFPKGYEFYSWELIQKWIAQGLIRSLKASQELEDVGQQYLNDLLSRSFFQDVENYTSFFSFKMHDLIHDLAQSVAKNDCSIVNFSAQNISNRVRHVSFYNIDLLEERVPRCLFELEKLRTIMIPIEGVGPSNKSFVKICVSRFKYLRMLDLSDSCFEVLPTSIGKLKHLRYLDLSNNGSIKKLPNSICKLYNLQTLDLHGCGKLEKLPRDIGNLINLRFLSLYTKQVNFSKEGIGRMNSLRYLEIGKSKNLKSLSEGIQYLTGLRTLIIWSCEGLEESLSCSMKYLTTLETLDIWDCKKLKLTESKEDIKGLSLSLQSLELDDFPQLVNLPQWVQGASNTLQLLSIRSCCNLVTLPDWLQNLTSLQKIEIEDCPNLLALPEGMHRLIALRELKIEDCPILMRRCQRETGEDWPKIAHVPNITLDEITSHEEATSERSSPYLDEIEVL